MTVPKATVDKDYCFEATKHEVGRAGQFPVMQAITITEAMKVTAYKHFRLSVFAFDRSHTIVALLFRHYICHVTIRQKYG